MENMITIAEQAGVSKEAARMAHQQIVTGLALAGYRVSSNEGCVARYESGERIESIIITVKYEKINKDKYGNELSAKDYWSGDGD